MQFRSRNAGLRLRLVYDRLRRRLGQLQRRRERRLRGGSEPECGRLRELRLGLRRRDPLLRERFVSGGVLGGLSVPAAHGGRLPRELRRRLQGLQPAVSGLELQRELVHLHERHFVRRRWHVHPRWADLPAELPLRHRRTQRGHQLHRHHPVPEWNDERALRDERALGQRQRTAPVPAWHDLCGERQGRRRRRCLLSVQRPVLLRVQRERQLHKPRPARWGHRSLRLSGRQLRKPDVPYRLDVHRRSQLRRRASDLCSRVELRLRERHCCGVRRHLRRATGGPVRERQRSGAPGPVLAILTPSSGT